ncbi:MAG TPA: histidine phosphatase family protein [Polyangium sp.]|nr:histidine phosphatase family protein [Polyangium sp.]
MKWQIPSSLLKHLELVPRDRPVAVLLRHSVRNRIPAGEVGNDVPITDDGERLATKLGEMIGSRLRSLRTSPVLRCVQTAQCLNHGAGTYHELPCDELLGEPGVYVIDGKLAWSNWERLGHEGVMQHLATSSEVLPGMAHPDVAARRLVRHTLEVMGDEPGLHVFVTHDLVIVATVARMMGHALPKEAWPSFLEGAFFWKNDAGVKVVYREQEGIGYIDGGERRS